MKDIKDGYIFKITQLKEMIAAKKIYKEVTYRLYMELHEKIVIYERHIRDYNEELELLQKELESVQ